MNDRLAAALHDLTSSDPRVRLTAVQTLGQVGETEAISPLIERLNDAEEQPEVIIAAVEALGRLRNPDGVEPLVAVLEKIWDWGNEDLATAAAWALGEIGDKRAIPALERLLDRREDDEFFFSAQREALLALAEFGRLETVERLATDSSRNRNLREEARGILASSL